MSSLNSEASAESGDQTSGALFNLFWTQEYCFAIKAALKVVHDSLHRVHKLHKALRRLYSVQIERGAPPSHTSAW